MRDLTEVPSLKTLVARIKRALETIADNVDIYVGEGDCDGLSDLCEQLQELAYMVK